MLEPLFVNGTATFAAVAQSPIEIPFEGLKLKSLQDSAASYIDTKIIEIVPNYEQVDTIEAVYLFELSNFRPAGSISI